jgi:hypothetical protein
MRGFFCRTFDADVMCAAANSHGRSLEGSDRSPSVVAAMTNVFCKAPAASAESSSIQWQ